MRFSRRHISEYIEDQLKAHYAMCWVKVSSKGESLKFDGSTERFGLPPLIVGDRLPEPLLSCWESRHFDHESGRQILPFVHLNNDHVVNMHFIDGEGGGYILLLDAASEHRLSQELQQKSNQARVLTLEQQRTLDQLHVAQIALEEKKEEAERASKAKGQFIAAMSHEFRTPITSILGYLELLKTQDARNPDAVNADSEKHLTAIRRSSWHLLTLVENLLDQARLDEEGVNIYPANVSVEDIAADIESLFSIQAHNRGLHLSVDYEPQLVVTLDPIKIRQVVINLVSNAIRYTDEGSVRVNFKFADGGLAIGISDTGHGISESDRERIFKPFERLNPDRPGTGLGLGISKRLVEAMGGRIDLHSVVDQGTDFAIWVPCSKLDPATQSATVARDILVVDDDQDLLELFRIVLEDWGSRVVLAGSVASARQQLAKRRFDVLLTDENLQDGFGSELISESHASSSANAFILISGDIDSVSKAVAPLADKVEEIAVLPKPVDFDQLASVLHGFHRREADRAAV